MNNDGQNSKYLKIITFDLIKDSLKKIIEKYKKNKDNELAKSKKFLIQINIDKLISLSKKIENIYSIFYNAKKKSFRLFKRKINYLIKSLLNKKDIKFKKYNHIDDVNKSLYVFISLLKIFISENNYKKIKNLLFILIKLSTKKEIYYEIFLLIIELILNILIFISQRNILIFFSLDEEPFNLIETIIDAMISYPDEIIIENPNKYILSNVIDLFDEYLFFPNYPNINLKQSTLWLKLLENNMFTPVNQNELIETKNNIGANINNRKQIQDILNYFLVKIYKFSMRNNYMENILFKNSIINLKYYISSISFLKKLFWDEINSSPLNEFKIKEGIYLPINKYLYFNKIEPKTNELSMIFSFKICKFIEGVEIDILEISDKKEKNIFKLLVDERRILILDNGDKNKMDTGIIIKENISYILCISIMNKKFFGHELELSINSSKKNEKNKNSKKDKEKNFVNFNGKINNFDSQKEISLALGKKNFIGVVGEFLIINKFLKNNEINYLLNLRENYANLLCKYYYDYKQISDGTSSKKTEHYYFKTKEFKDSQDFFKELNYDIVFEYMSNDINRFIKPRNIFTCLDFNHDIDKKTINPINFIHEDSLQNNNIDNDENNKNILIFKNLSKMNYSFSLFSKNNGMDFLTFQLYNIFSKIDDIDLLNMFLLESLSFIMELINYQLNTYKDSSGNFDTKLPIFLLALLILLYNKKDKIYFNNNTILKLIEIFEHFKSFKLTNERNIILSILLNIDFYKKKEDIFGFQQIFGSLKSILEEKYEDSFSLFNKEFLYKLLSLDYLFETEKKHKFLTEIISDFVSIEPQKENEIHQNFILYLFRLESEKKIYHYLKIIYMNLDKFSILKEKQKENENDKEKDKNYYLLKNIKNNMENIDYNHCKYCSYNQILFYLIYEEINNEINNEIDRSNKDDKYHFYEGGFMKNPNDLFIRCFFSQIFSIPKDGRFKFIKSKLKIDPIDYIFSLLKDKKLDFKFKEIKHKLEYILEYIKFLHERKDKYEISDKINYLLKLLNSFLRRYSKSQYELNIIENECMNNNKNNINKNKKNKKNKNSIENEKINLNTKNKELYYQDLFTSKFNESFFKPKTKILKILKMKILRGIKNYNYLIL